MTIVNIILLVVVVAAGGFFLVYGIRQLQTARTARMTWPTTQGVVTASGMESFDGPSKKGRATTRYMLQVFYQYKVGEQMLEGRQIAFGGTSYGLVTAHEKLRIYPQGAVVTVYYDPSDPSKAVLEPEAVGIGSYFVLGIVILVFGSLAILLMP